ncbi:uncharacterized protein TNCV_4705231 [Trichonephila clavipes]|nr:uncharacterized protein TNCV_4705231 [Trichonephila clavipes]
MLLSKTPPSAERRRFRSLVAMQILNPRDVPYHPLKFIPMILAQSVQLVPIEAAVAEWYKYRTVACFVTGSNPVPLKTRRVGQRCTLNLSRAETSSRWCGVVVRRGGASSGVVHVT